MLENRARLQGAFVGAPGVSLALADALQPGDVLFDCGAFHGWLTRLGSAAVGPTGKIVAFEPSAARAVLARNVGHLSNVTIEPLAISETSGSARFKTSGNPSDQGSKLSDAAEGDLVQVTSIDDYARRTGVWPDVIKLDVEGFEAAALRGATEALKRVRFVVFEQHTEDQDARPILESHGFITRNVYTLADAWPQDTPCTDFLAARPAGRWWENVTMRLFKQIQMVAEGGVQVAQIELTPGRYLLKASVQASNPHQSVSMSITSPQLDALGKFSSGAEAHWLNRISGIPIDLSDAETVEVRISPFGAGADKTTITPGMLQILKID